MQFHQKKMEIKLGIVLGSKMSDNKKLHDKADTIAEILFANDESW